MALRGGTRFARAALLITIVAMVLAVPIVLGGMSPIDSSFLHRLREHGALDQLEVQTPLRPVVRDLQHTRAEEVASPVRSSGKSRSNTG